jgi:type I restriction enzyme S subunit
MEKLLPQLRFPKFKGEWGTKKLGEWDLKVIDGDRGTNYPNGDDFSSEGYCLFMNAKNVTKNGFSFETKMFVTKEKDEKLRKGKLKRNDLILTTRGSVGNIAYYDNSIKYEHLRINSGMVLIRNENSQIDSNFIYISFFTPRLNRIIDTISFGSAQPQLTVKEINLFKLYLPSLSEQTKIASFLTAVDGKLTALNQKKTLLEQYKKGVMQQIFSQELRFKDDNGNDFADWEEKTFGDVTKFINGKAYKQTELLNEGKYRVLRVGNLFSNNEWYYSDFELDKDKYIEKGDLIYAWSASFGPRFWKEEKLIYHYHIWKVIPNNNIDKQFLYHVFMFDVESLKKQSQGGTMFHITKGNIESRLFYFPCLEEQIKIANFLAAIDEKINHCQGQIKKAGIWKKGLLQQLFV